MPYANPVKQKHVQHLCYLRDKSGYRSRGAKRRKQRILWYQKMMKGRSCFYCQESCIACLDWHHLDPAEKVCEVSKMVKDFHPYKNIFAEMKKCVVLCANC